MRNFLLISNALVALVFASFFAYTFMGRQHIDRVARSFVSAKTQRYAEPVVDAVSEGLHSELAQRLLTKDQKVAIAAEIAEFREQPSLFIQRLTAMKSLEKPRSFRTRLSETFHGWKERIRSHYNKVLGRLFTDLRIFAGSNVIAACIAFVCAFRAPREPTFRLKLYSILLLISIGMGVYYYVDHFSFFTILFDWYLGWWYPALLVVLFGDLYLEYARDRRRPVGLNL